MRPPLNPILLRLKAQLAGAEGTGRLTRADILMLAEMAIELEDLRAWIRHDPQRCDWDGAPAWKKKCTCGLGGRGGASEAEGSRARKRFQIQGP